MKKIWKAALICAGIAVCVVLYVRQGKAEESAEETSVSLTGEISVSAEGDSGTESAEENGGEGTGSEGTAAISSFTEAQKEELRTIVKEAVSEACGETLETSVRTALENCLSQMQEDGRLESAVVKYAAVQSSLVNVNTAGLEELMKLNGIGSAKAQAIISYREEHGAFSSLEELTNISGISAGTLEKFRDQVTL